MNANQKGKKGEREFAAVFRDTGSPASNERFTKPNTRQAGQRHSGRKCGNLKQQFQSPEVKTLLNTNNLRLKVVSGNV